MANLLKFELSVDERYQNFARECSLTRQRVQQTKLYFLIPPQQRTKARYHNVDTLIDWARKVIQYESLQDFSRISTTYHLDNEALLLLSNTLNAELVISIGCFKPQIYENRHQFTQALLNHLGQDLWHIHGELICQCADLGRRKFYLKLGWLSSYYQDIQTYAQMLTLVQNVQTQLKTQGLHRLSHQQWSQKNALVFPPRVQQFHRKIQEYLTVESLKIPEEETLLSTSDVIESIFGKYKFLAAKRPLKDIGTSILLIPLLTLTITTDLVKRAMETIRFLDVRSWAKSIFGSSMLSHRRSLSLITTSDTEVA